MKIIGNSEFTAEPAAVWDALVDPAVLVRSIPGCQRLEALGEDAYAMTLAAGVGSIKGVYDGRVRLSDQQQPGSFRMHAEGAGAAGTINAEVLVTLTDSGHGGTSVTYDADASVGGMIGGVGQRMLVGVSKRMAAEFFTNVDAALGEGAAAAEIPGTAKVDGSEGPASAGRQPGFDAGAVFTPPQARPSGGGGSFAQGVAVGAAAALAGAFVGAWISRRAGRRG